MAKRRSKRVEPDGLRALAQVIKSAGLKRPAAPGETPLSTSERNALAVQGRLASVRMRLRVKAVGIGGEVFPLV